MAVLITCHNRRTLTLACLSALYACDKLENFLLDVVLVDDGSTDGTKEEISEAFPDVHILCGDGTLFWNRGMHKAFNYALASKYDYYLWLNDDTILSTDALRRLIATEAAIRRKSRPGLVVGSTFDPDTGLRTYGGLRRRRRLRPLKFDPVRPLADPVVCDAMNGNCVLIPAEVAAVVGNLDLAFEHSMGDLDYALRARQSGFLVCLAPGFVGACKGHATPNECSVSSVSIRAKLRDITHRKNLPMRAWAVFARRHAGPLWPLYWAWPYLKAMLH